MPPSMVLAPLVVLVLLWRVNGMERMVMARFAPKGMTHGFLLRAEALRSRRGQVAWAPRLTLVRILDATVSKVKRST
jgi:hypothetical protein